MGRKMRSPTIHCTRKRPYHSKRCSTCAAWQREWSAARVHQPPLRKGPQEDVPDPRRPERLTTTTEYRITTCHGRRTRRCRLLQVFCPFFSWAARSFALGDCVSLVGSCHLLRRCNAGTFSAAADRRTGDGRHRRGVRVAAVVATSPCERLLLHHTPFEHVRSPTGRARCAAVATEPDGCCSLPCRPPAAVRSVRQPSGGGGSAGHPRLPQR